MTSIDLHRVAKAKQLQAFLQEQVRIYIMVDATRDDVDVPEFLQGDPALRLVLNLRMPQIITIDYASIRSDLSFSGQVHACTIPLDAVWAACDKNGDMTAGLFWEESVPSLMREAMRVLSDVDLADSTIEHSVDDIVARISLASESDSRLEDAEKPGEEADTKPGSSKRAKASHLRVIK